MPLFPFVPVIEDRAAALQFAVVRGAAQLAGGWTTGSAPEGAEPVEGESIVAAVQDPDYGTLLARPHPGADPAALLLTTGDMIGLLTPPPGAGRNPAAWPLAEHVCAVLFGWNLGELCEINPATAPAAAAWAERASLSMLRIGIRSETPTGDISGAVFVVTPRNELSSSITLDALTFSPDRRRDDALPLAAPAARSRIALFAGAPVGDGVDLNDDQALADRLGCEYPEMAAALLTRLRPDETALSVAYCFPYKDFIQLVPRLALRRAGFARPLDDDILAAFIGAAPPLAPVTLTRRAAPGPTIEEGLRARLPGELAEAGLPEPPDVSLWGIDRGAAAQRRLADLLSFGQPAFPLTAPSWSAAGLLVVDWALVYALIHSISGAMGTALCPMPAQGAATAAELRALFPRLAVTLQELLNALPPATTRITLHPPLESKAGPPDDLPATDDLTMIEISLSMTDRGGRIYVFLPSGVLAEENADGA